MPYPGLLPALDCDADSGTIENLLKKRLPNSLKGLVLGHLLQEVEGTKAAQAVADLKLQGGLQNLKVVTLEFIDPEMILHAGFPSLTLDELKVGIKAKVGEAFKEAKLELKLGISV